MAAAKAFNVVKQIQALADGDKMYELRECLGQVVTSLQFFLDHPDSRVRLSAARTLAKLCTGFRKEIDAMDLGRTSACFTRCKNAVVSGEAEEDTQELCSILAEVLNEENPLPRSDGQDSAGTKHIDPALASSTPPSSGAPTPAAASSAPKSSIEERGEVVLKVGENADSKMKAGILERVVTLAGAMSVTFEGPYVIVSTRSPAIAQDAGFLAQLLTAVQKQGIEGVSLVSASGAGGGALAAGSTEGADTRGNTASTGLSSQSGKSEETEPVGVQDEEDDDEPAYLDDDDDEEDSIQGGGTAQGMPTGAPFGGGQFVGPGAANWSFFSQQHWMTGRRLQEFDDDPTIAARLAKAKRREEEKKKEEKSRLGKIFSAFGRW